MLRFAELASQPRSVEQILREWIEPPEDQATASTLPNTPQRCRDLEDQLSLLARWFYKKPRVGEIFSREGTARLSSAVPQDVAPATALSGIVRRNSEWPYRRILRACSRLLAPPAETAEVDS